MKFRIVKDGDSWWVCRTANPDEDSGRLLCHTRGRAEREQARLNKLKHPPGFVTKLTKRTKWGVR